MQINLSKFGSTLVSRQAGREALAAFEPMLKDIGPNEDIVISFDGVNTFSPSWGSEFLDSLTSRFGDRVVLKKSDNSSVLATLRFLEKIGSKKFRMVS